ncbi:UNVERIFIED_CONTAM: Zinc finger protein ZAT5 [Sesamum latifolium]|uniref:Zinc finger protein ZAT5 n=1 Tax=Sesamum latifolium TaxID=2727402 RepID=A0AAW2XDN3_9LAMI
MEAVEEVLEPPCTQNKLDISAVAKGKRTKRLRPHSPIPFTVTQPSTIAGEYGTAASPRLSPGFSAASEEESTTTEEEDTARCLILLSQGYFPSNNKNDDVHDFQHFKQSAANATATVAVATEKVGGACQYACKTCDRVFPSFQALGGHRASHRKPKNEKKSAFFSDEEDLPSPSTLPSKRKLPLNPLSSTEQHFRRRRPQAVTFPENSRMLLLRGGVHVRPGPRRTHEAAPGAPYQPVTEPTTSF